MGTRVDRGLERSSAVIPRQKGLLMEEEKDITSQLDLWQNNLRTASLEKITHPQLTKSCPKIWRITDDSTDDVFGLRAAEVAQKRNQARRAYWGEQIHWRVPDDDNDSCITRTIIMPDMSAPSSASSATPDSPATATGGVLSLAELTAKNPALATAMAAGGQTSTKSSAAAELLGMTSDDEDGDVSAQQKLITAMKVATRAASTSIITVKTSSYPIQPQEFSNSNVNMFILLMPGASMLHMCTFRLQI